MYRLLAPALLLAAGFAAPVAAQTMAPDEFRAGQSVSQPANGLPGVGMGIGTAGGDRGSRGPGGLQNGVGAYGNMTPDASGSAGNTLTRVPGAIPEGGRSGVGIPLGGPAVRGN
ncbi:hypothetical protein [Aureimonas sp. SK2]|uniref:hypothetical protein n=1 Tax=Aureimonas sp. SK2 TaxID=3015992 RepID=UPI002444AC7E|nr:hypothetical protein [Aureimonas sp. SK2]